MAPRRLQANSCDGGPCPTFHFDDPAVVRVQGYVTSLPGSRVPAGEDVIAIPPDAWARLLADLPVAMLLRALVAPWRFRRSRPIPHVTAPAVR